MSRWENPDPRVKWALDKLDDEGFEQRSLFGYHALTVGWGVGLGALVPLFNYASRR